MNAPSRWANHPDRSALYDGQRETDSLLEGAGFEPSVPVLGGSVSRVISLFGLRGIRRRNEGLDSVRLARSGFPPQSMELIFFRHPAHRARVLGCSVYDAVGN